MSVDCQLFVELPTQSGSNVTARSERRVLPLALLPRFSFAGATVLVETHEGFGKTSQHV